MIVIALLGSTLRDWQFMLGLVTGSGCGISGCSRQSVTTDASRFSCHLLPDEHGDLFPCLLEAAQVVGILLQVSQEPISVPEIRHSARDMACVAEVGGT